MNDLDKFREDILQTLNGTLENEIGALDRRFDSINVTLDLILQRLGGVPERYVIHEDGDLVDAVPIDSSK